MKPRLKSSPAARELVKRFEPFRETAIRGADGRWVVGYGHRAAARGGIKVSEEEASLLLIYDMMKAETAIDDIADIPLSRGQRDALVSFVHDIGQDAFRNSDVARFLYEGRLDAAGEALAAHGDGTNPRREAESRMFLDAMVPAKAERPSVELVIKVEHPKEARVLEGAVSGGAGEPVEDYAPPPPPMPDRRITSRAEAEAEIARILATVEAMPIEALEPAAADSAMAPVESAVSDMSDEPVEAEYEAVAEEPDAQDTPDDEAAPDSTEAEVAARMSEELDAAEAAAPAPVMPAADFSLPDGTELGFALTHLPVPDAPETSVSEAGTDRADEADAIAELPATVELGYAFTAVMTARFRPASGPAAAEPQATGTGPESDAVPAVEEAGAAGRDTVPDGEGLDPVTLPEAGPETAVTEIVERAVAVAGQDAPPPHPSDTPAQSAGAVGEVEAEKSDTPEPEIQPVEDDLLDGDDPLMTGTETEDEEEAFSPRDLAADLPPESEKKADVKSDDGSWGYLASLAAGAVVTAFGAVMTWGDWGRMWETRSLTGDAWALIAGVFLMLAAAWSLGSVWLGRLKNNRRNTTDAG
jgi:GH24 family phage-related lysozyme (muramidase)